MRYNGHQRAHYERDAVPREFNVGIRHIYDWRVRWMLMLRGKDGAKGKVSLRDKPFIVRP